MAVVGGLIALHGGPVSIVFLALALTWFLATAVFQADPAKIFPFPVSGCNKFTTGATSRLDALGGLPNSVGTVSVETTRTSVTFTVVSDDYFDARGSTIQFETYESGGVLMLRNTARSSGLKPWYALAKPLFYAGAYLQWTDQAVRLRNVLKRKK